MNNKIIQTISYFSALLLFVATAQADILCVSKVISVKKGTVDMNSALKVVKRKKCPKNFISVLDIDDYLSGKADKSALRNYATNGALNSALADKANVAAVAEALADKADVSDLAAKANISDLATKADRNALKDYEKSADLNTALAKKADSADLEGKVNWVLQPGETITGESYGSYGYDSIYLPIPAPTQIDESSIGTPEECTGDAHNPTAAPGKVCAYSYTPGSGLVEVIPGYTYDLSASDTEEECISIGGKWTEPACVLKYNTRSPIDDEEMCIEAGGTFLDERPHGKCIDPNIDEESCNVKCTWDPKAYNDRYDRNGLCYCRGRAEEYYGEEECLEESTSEYFVGECSKGVKVYSNVLFSFGDGYSIHAAWAYTAPLE